ncbi:MAG: hypothetical protein H6555_03945 [Lewinellaceae bacterium]|nr:hypothetical protein [Lewinellaceae bacterium]
MLKVDPSLTAFTATLEERIRAAWASQESNEALASLVEGLGVIVAEAVQIGDTATEYIAASGKKVSEDLHGHYITSYSWPAAVKSFGLLWRDTIYQYQKAVLLTAEGKVTASGLAQLAVQSQEVLLAAAAELADFPQAEVQKTGAARGGKLRQLRQWQLQQNPWPVYAGQLNALVQQGQQLTRQYEMLNQQRQHFNQIRDLVHHVLQKSRASLVNQEVLAKEMITYIGENLQEKPGKIVQEIDEVVEAGDNVPEEVVAFADALTGITQLLAGQEKVYQDPQQGLLPYKEIHFQRSTRAWLESEILPLYYEVMEIMEQGGNNLRMSLLNIRNRVLLYANERKEGRTLPIASEEMTRPLQHFQANVKSWIGQLDQLIQVITERLGETLQITSVYSPKGGFLAIPFQTNTRRQLKIRRSELVSRAQAWIQNQGKLIRRFRREIAQEEALSVSEKIARLVQQRTIDPTNTAYSSIFLTKGYIGESFWVGREEVLNRMERLIGQWRGGIRGAALVYGRRFAGKSLFGELVAHRFFTAREVIRLQPTQLITVNGRTMNPGYDLGAALAFIRKYALQQRPLIWIDDLELWNDPPDNSISNNVHQLKAFIDDYSDQFFFLVSMSTWLRAHLQQAYQLGEAFQAEINLDMVSSAEVLDAILIRHGATHKTLVDENGEPVTPRQFERMTQKAYRNAGANLGEALNYWAYCLKKWDDHRVVFRDPPAVGLPDFLTSDTALVLAVVILEKRTNEYRLRKRFGPAFKHTYGSVVQRLLHTGILVRQLDGWLEVREILVNEVASVLEHKQYFPTAPKAKV